MAEKTISPEDLRTAVPDMSKPATLQGLDDGVEVFRDAFGIPHIRANSTHDAFFGQGFVTAQDRLWQMEHDRRQAYGRWAEYVGPSAAEQDLMMRRFQILASVKEDFQHLNTETRAMLEAYSAGVNAFIGTTGSLPIEYTLVEAQPGPWQPWDCLAVFKVRHIMMGGFESKLWRAKMVSVLGPEKTAGLLKGYQPGGLTIIPPGTDYAGPLLDGLEELSQGLEAVRWYRDADSGSNNWALSGSRTASGKPLLAGDPHRALDTPNVYYQNHISCSEFDVVGLSFPGFPGFPHFGHNAQVAWCVTHAMADYQDLYVERFKEGEPGLYEWKGKWDQAEVRPERIQVRGAPSRDLDVIVTRHGPIIAGGPTTGYGIAFKYTATNAPAMPNKGFESVLPMLTSNTVDEVEESMRAWVDPGNNFLFADIHGDIGYVTRGKVPQRSTANAWLPVPGWTGEHEWTGHVPFEEMPRSRNPETGYIVTANNRITGNEYPHYLGLDHAPEYRARRIQRRLEPMTSATVQDMAAVHAERISMPAQVYKKILAEVDISDDMVAEARRRLLDWDSSMERDLVAPTVYSAFRLELLRAMARHHLGPLAEEILAGTNRAAMMFMLQISSRLATNANDGDTSLLPTGSDWAAVASNALTDGVAYLCQKLGDDMDTWQWSKLHFTRPQHTLSEAFPELASLLDPPSVPLGGDGDTPQSASYSMAEPFVMTGMSTARYVYDLSDWDNSAWVIPLGASGHPGSPHYADQAPIWGEVQLIPMLYTWDQIEAKAKIRQPLSP